MAEVSRKSAGHMNSPINSAPTEVRLDMSTITGSIGRIKAAPICVDETLKKEAMSAVELSQYCFPKKSSPSATFAQSDLPESAPVSSTVSSSSSTGSRDSNFSDFEGNTKFHTPLRLERKESERINLKVTSRKTSRNGRQSQRWSTDPNSQKVFRLVTGCVPVVEGGKILFASSSRKPEWILPKGGWETDEAMEESAIRESFEEAGVIGILGERLSPIEYETRKAKKRRLEFEELRKKSKIVNSPRSPCPTGGDHKEFHEMKNVLKTDSTDSGKEGNLQRVQVDVSSIKGSGTPSLNPVSDDDMARIREQWRKQSDETSSVASDASHTHSHVRMHLFPLYVTEVKSSWPESGRFRKVVEIDEAIQMLESRPELRAAIMEVKERNLHILPREQLKFPQSDPSNAPHRVDDR